MGTFILFWNPDISSYDMESHHHLLAGYSVEYITETVQQITPLPSISPSREYHTAN